MQKAVAASQHGAALVTPFSTAPFSPQNGVFLGEDFAFWGSFWSKIAANERAAAKAKIQISLCRAGTYLDVEGRRPLSGSHLGAACFAFYVHRNGRGDNRKAVRAVILRVAGEKSRAFFIKRRASEELRPMLNVCKHRQAM